MRAVLLYLALSCYFAFVPALVIGALVSLFDAEWGIITVGAVFGWIFTDMLIARKGKWFI